MDQLGLLFLRVNAQVLADNLGLAAAVAMVAFVRNMPRARATLPFALYPLLASADLFFIHKELKCVELKTINKVPARQLLSSRYVLGTHTKRLKLLANISLNQRREVMPG